MRHPSAVEEPARFRAARSTQRAVSVMRFAQWLVLIGLGAMAVRMLYIFVIAPAPIGVGGDSGFYESAANLIAHGHFYERTIFNHSYATAEHPPLYPLVLSIASLLGGTSTNAHRVLSCGIGSGAVVLIAVLGKRIGGRRAGILAGSVAALYPPFITADGFVMSEPLFTLLVAGALLVGLALVERLSLGRAVFLGAVIGLATLTRAEGLALIPLLGWPAAAGGSRDGRVWRALAVTAATIVVLTPWVAHNIVVFHRAIIATDSNTLLAGANCHEAYYGHDIGWWVMKCLKRSRTPRQLSTGDASTTPAFTYAGRHLGRLPLVAAVRVLRTFDLFQPLRQGNQEPRRRWVDVVGLVIYYPLLVLSGFGLVRLGRRCRSERILLLAPIVMVVVVSALGWGIGRFRVSADITIVVLAAFAAVGTAVVTPMRRTADQPSLAKHGSAQTPHQPPTARPSPDHR